MDEDCLNSVFFYFKKRKEAEQKYLVKLRRAVKQTESSRIALNTTSLVALQCGELKLKIQAKKTFPPCPPWNGSHNGISMTNTCTIDNALYTIHVALLNSVQLSAAFRSSDNPVLNKLYEMRQCFEREQFELGKYMCFQQFHDFQLFLLIKHRTQR